MKKIVAILMVMIMVISVTVVLAGSAPDNDTKTKEPVIIGFKSTPGHADKAMVRGHGGEIKHSYTIIDAIAAKLPEQAIENIQKNPRVTYVEMDGEVHAHDSELDISWGVKRIGAGTVHDSDNTGADVKVAIIDTGIDYTHSDLDDNYVGGYDFVSDDADPMDDNGHGTHCAGIVAAKDDGEGVVGVAPDAHLYGVKVLDSTGSGSSSDVIAGIDWSVKNGMEIISMSLGGGSYLESMEDACDAAYDADIVVVASAGNSGNPRGRGDNVGYPARYDSVIAVAATDSNDVRARWSSTGPDVELAAPGVSIYSTYKGGEYVYMSGTSMACPHVAGTAALAIASGESNVRQCLQQTAEDLGDLGKDNLYGHGLVDAAAATGSGVTLESIEITPETASIPKALTQQYTATGTYTDDSTADITSSVTWESFDTVVATISSAGLATGVGEGSTGITATLGLISGTATLTVTAPILQSITVTPDTATIEVGVTQKYTAEGTYSDGSTLDITSSVNWESSETAVAIIDSTGLATGVGEGTTTITAKSNSISNTAELTVTLALESIAVTPAIATIPKGLTQQYTATGTYTDDSTADITSSVTWESFDTVVATISSAGLATGVGEGSTGITATLGLISGTATLTVTAPILQSITVTPDTATIEVGVTQKYTAEGTYSDGSTLDITSSVNWESSETAVAIIDSTGLATGVGEGTTTITAKSNSISNTAELTVTLALESIAVTPATTTISKGLTQQYTATGTYTDDSTADITSSVTWASSDTAVATIDSAGLATAVSEGSTGITATLGSEVSNEAELTVTAPSEPTTVSVKSISYRTEGGRDGNKHLLITVALVDDLGNLVADASVSIEVDRDSLPYGSYTGTTGTGGTVTFQTNNAPSGIYTTTVTVVIAGELNWDGATPEENSFTKE